MKNLKKDIKLFKFTFKAMTTPCEVQIYETNEEKAKNCFETIKQSTYDLERKYSFYEEESYLNRKINNRKSNDIRVDHLTCEILKKVKNISSQTGGLFDITVGTIKHCYNLNSLDEIEKCKSELASKMGDDSWSMNENEVSFRHSETKFDLGGVIKEYAVDIAGQIIKEYDIKSALVNYGGDILSVGVKPDGNAFCIGIKNPHNTKENLLYVNIANQALTTSASYERNRLVEDKEISHIMSKKDLEMDILSSTIVCDSALESGIYSTSFMIDPESCEISEDMKVVLIDKDLNIHQNLVQD